MCSNVLFLMAGSNSELMQYAKLPKILRFTPAGAATKQLIHYGQGIRSNDFRQFDNGFIENLRRYGSRRPPAYPLNNVNAPVALHYSMNDYLAAVVDVQRLAAELPNVVHKRLVPHTHFNHLDFNWARGVEELLYNQVLELMKQADSANSD